VSIKAFIGLTRTFSVLKVTGYSYNMMTSEMSKAQGKFDFSVHHPFKWLDSHCWSHIFNTFILHKK